MNCGGASGSILEPVWEIAGGASGSIPRRVFGRLRGAPVARLLDQVVGHREILARLLEARSEDRLPGTMLFTGPDGVGRKLVAHALAQAICCPVHKHGCGTCGSCLRIAHRQSESVLWIAAEKNQIKIEQSRAVLDFLSLQAWAGSRVVIFENAEGLNPQASNALLKILEEPPPQSYFFLIARSPRHVLPTVRSRAVHIPFHPLAAADLAKKVQSTAQVGAFGTSADATGGVPAWMLEAAQGSFARLQDLMESETRGPSIEMITWWLESPQAYLRPAFRERTKERLTASQIARHFQGFFRDLALRRAGVRRGLCFPDQAELLERAKPWLPQAPSIFRLALG
ncbi:MAG: hypothetical protein C5B49_13825, partial [Bdellovibrio sp.]